MKVKRNPLDILFAEYIKLRDKVCQRCFNPNNKVMTAHFHGRSAKSVRWDEDNACCLCLGDHTYLDSHPLEKIEFFRTRLGEDGFNALNSRYRNTWPRPDKKLIEIYLQEEIKKLGNHSKEGR